MNKTTEALAVKALEMIAGERMCINNLLSDKDIAREALAAIREPLADQFRDATKMVAEPVKQEPVALSFPRDTTSWTGGWTIDYKLVRSVDDAIDDNEFKPCLESVEQVLLALEKVYAAPVSAKREWVDLTDDEKGKVWGDWYVSGFYNEELIDRAITAFKEKNK